MNGTQPASKCQFITHTQIFAHNLPFIHYINRKRDVDFVQLLLFCYYYYYYADDFCCSWWWWWCYCFGCGCMDVAHSLIHSLARSLDDEWCNQEKLHNILFCFVIFLLFVIFVAVAVVVVLLLLDGSILYIFESSNFPYSI